MREKTDATSVWDDVATEFLHLYPRGGRLIGVAGTDASRSTAAADELAAALARAGQTVERTHSDDGDEGALRDGPIAAFRTDRSADRVLVASGPAALLTPSARGLWNFSVWQLAGDEQPHTAASVLIDVTDPAHPTRRFADYCALPAAYSA